MNDRLSTILQLKFWNNNITLYLVNIYYVYILNINLMMPLNCLKAFTSSWIYFVCLTNLLSPIFKRLTLSTYYFRFTWLVPLLPSELCSNFTLSKMYLPNWSHSTSFHLLYFIHSSMQTEIYISLFYLFVCHPEFTRL